ncbi:MAG: tetraacyldisaccharide 4'-kinase [Pseudomonadota bacterium]
MQNSWQQPNLLTILLWPLSLLYRLGFLLKKSTYTLGLRKAYRAPVPLIVVGNITVGGTGKTPLVVHLVEQLRLLGYTPGVISRGYGGQSDTYPLLVTSDTPAELAGDEPVLIQRRCNVPLVVGPDRKADIELLLESGTVDIIVSDDGLQHFAMARDIEICVVDESRPQTNQHLLPAGPYREPRSRLQSVDILVTHHKPNGSLNEQKGTNNQESEAIVMSLRASDPLPLIQPEQRALDSNQGLHAVAGIGNPQRFFHSCREQGWQIVEHVFEDHHRYSASDLLFGDDLPVIMTEKDAVKCKKFASEAHWYLPVSVKMSASFNSKLTLLLERLDTHHAKQ